MKLELIPLLIIALLMISAGGAEVDSAELLIEGEQEITEHRGALIVGDATVTVPAGAAIEGPVYVIGGVLRVQGEVGGDVTQLSGTVVVEDGAAIGGELFHVAGTERIAEGAEIPLRTTVEPASNQPGPVARILPRLIVTGVLAVVAGWLAGRWRRAFDNVGAAVHDHPVVSLTVGGLVFVTFLSLFVFMAFTLVLIPVALLGLLVGLIAILYGIAGWGHAIGAGFDVERVDVATALGVIGVMVFVQAVALIPYVGDVLAGGVLLIGFGAVVISFFGMTRFEPPDIPT